MARRSWHERVYRALLKVLPKEFRSDFEESMTEDFRDQRADAVARGGGRSIRRLWWRTFTGMFRVAPAEHAGLLRRDAGYAWRLLRRRPAFAASTILTLAAGIGLNTAVFSVVHGIVLRRLPMPESERLVRLYEVSPKQEEDAVSGENFMDWRTQARTLDGLALIGSASGTLTGFGAPEDIRGMSVSEDFFPMVGARPLHGRLFADEDFKDWRAARSTKSSNWPRPTVMVMSRELWLRRFGGDPGVVGTTVTLGGDRVQVIGIIAGTLDPHFFGADAAQYWVPGGAPPGIRRRGRNFDAIGRLAPGVSLEEAQSELTVIGDALAAQYPDANKGWTIRATPLLQDTSASVRTQLWFLFGAAACVLIITCANVANLVLAHAAGRRHELATRIALGASRRVLVRQALTEGLLMGGIGGGIGLIIALIGVPALVTLAPADTPRLAEISVSVPVLAFTSILSIVAGLACGLAACLSLDRANPKIGFRQAGADTSRRRPIRSVLSVTQVALALMLTVACGLLIRTMRAVEGLELGFRPDHVLAIGISPDFRKYGSVEAIQQFNARLLDRLKGHPGIVAAGVGSRPLGGGASGVSTVVRVPGGSADGVRMGMDSTSPGYFAALGLGLVTGRLFTDTDNRQAPAAAILNERAARDLGIADAPIGRTVTIDSQSMQVVGIVADSRRGALEAAPAPAIYLPFLQHTRSTTGQVLIRTNGDPMAIVGDVRDVVGELDPDLALRNIQTLDERLGESLAPRRFILRLVGLFSVLALALAMIGLYGVIAESVAQRVPEIGVRMALGAAPIDILRLVMTQGGWIVGAGVALGMGGAMAMRDSMASFVFGVPTSDPLSFVVAALSLAAATLLACLLPARRAAAVDPVIALRQD